MNFGVSVALLTPFCTDMTIDQALFNDHAIEMLERGADGITMFGTTGEGASIGAEERRVSIAAMNKSGVPAEKITVGICANSLGDALDQVRHACSLGVSKFLVLPPFYFKGINEDALYEWHVSMLERAPREAQFILYHIPQITQIPISQTLAKRLATDFSKQVIGLKDSEGDWSKTYDRLKDGSIPILVGDERALHKAVAIGGAGSICGMANLYPERIRQILTTHEEDHDLCTDVNLIVGHPVIAAIKQAKVILSGNDNWGRLRSPLNALDAAARAQISERFLR